MESPNNTESFWRHILEGFCWDPETDNVQHKSFSSQQQAEEGRDERSSFEGSALEESMQVLRERKKEILIGVGVAVGLLALLKRIKK